MEEEAGEPARPVGVAVGALFETLVAAPAAFAATAELAAPRKAAERVYKKDRGGSE